jgi:drug/metabolite transporter (DMT)-like permease
MPLFAFLLILTSTFSHAWWNFLAKQASNKDIFFGISKMAEVSIFAIPFAWLLVGEPFDFSGWYFILIAALLIFTYYFFLAQAYKRVELSVAYPIARSSTLFLPVLSYYFIGETIDAVGMASVILVTLGVLIIQLDAFSKKDFARLAGQFTRPGIIFALLTALTVASYTLWDKVAITRLHPFLYFYSYTAVSGLFYFIFIAIRFSQTEIQQEWRDHKRAIISVALLDMFTYLLVLAALSFSKATYVGALRQLSLVAGVFLGWKFLQEQLSSPRIVGVLLLMLGGTLILFAR